ncbi:hypothetical protein F503_04367 [Ophiostoma piceae UAMH 11346]|uniref:Uncharacterized protein n=1 Tax=Ophiostoma piceae (strain UAMH 11346) TaxID=1262450 RepID=S3D5W7_OPHP1|nr:hypothetical protein F503_04367 [Ophiostoma piceae UAMH 11346]
MSASAPTSTPTFNGSLRDDSAIGKSWDRVVSDYKTFHDVLAHGGTVRDLPVFPDTYNRQERQETSQDARPETNVSTAQQANASGAAKNGVNTSDNVDGDDGPDGSGSGDGPVGYDSRPGLTTAQASKADSQALPANTLDTASPSPF